jgi:uncharacterized protein GlcG (DUF336 family)
MHHLRPLLLTAMAATTVLNGSTAIALEQQPVLSVALAAEMALKALETCRAQKFAVAVTVVNREGNMITMLRHQDAGVHTVPNSFNKAFTVVSFGRAYGFDSTRAIIDATKPGRGIGDFPLPASPLPGLSYSIGGIALQSRGIVIRAIGVSGAPNGNLDEKCAKAGVQAIGNQLN